MGYIIECKTMQATAVKTVADTLNSLLRDINLTFTPYYIDSSYSDNESDEDDSSDGDSEDGVEENDTKALDNVDKKIGGVIIKEVNKTSSILVYAKLNADKFDHYVYKYHKNKFTMLLICLIF